jgi:signal transduction histidine kinase
MMIDKVQLSQRIAEICALDEQVAYLIVTADLNIRSISANLHTHFPRNTGGVIGEPLLSEIWELAGSEDQIQSVVSGNTPALLIEKLNWRLPDGGSHYIDLGIHPILPSDPAAGLIVLIQLNQIGPLQQRLVQDRNELRLAQRRLAEANTQLENLNGLKSLFLSMAAHDLRGPLTAILGYAQLIELRVAKEADAVLQDYSSIIIEQIRQMNYLITDLLDLDHIDRDQLIVRSADTNLTELVRSMSQLGAHASEKKNISIDLFLPEEPLQVWADPDKVRQIFYNILSNAIKYTGPGGKITIRVVESSEWGIFSVEDSGEGLSESDLARLFQLYYRTEDAQSSSVSGTGLGLYIVKSLLDAMAGRVEAESTKGVGSTFRVYLPLTPK